MRGDLAGYGAKRALGQLIRLRVRVVDEDGAPVPGAVVEVWHCNAAGKYIHPNDTHDAPVDPNFYGAARLVAGDSGLVELRTIKPGAYPVPDTGGWWRPPHVHFSVWGRVWLSRLVTQMFFPGEPLNERDAILNAIRDPRRASAASRASRRPRVQPTRWCTSTSSWCAGARPPGHAVSKLMPTAEMTLGPFFPREFAQGANDLAEGAAR